MPVIDPQIVESIKLVASLNAMNERDSARELGRKIIYTLSLEKDGYLFALIYDLEHLDTGDVKTLLDAAFLARCLKEVYLEFKALTMGSKAEYWFKNGVNNNDLHTFFLFLARKNKSINVDKDPLIFSNVIKALKNNPSYDIPTSLYNFTLDRFLNAISTGEIKVDRNGVR